MENKEQLLNLNTGLENRYMDYLFAKINGLFNNSINFPLIGDIFVIVLSVFAIFFLFVIAYSAVRIMEVRKKEHEHLQQEIAEYAHHQSEKIKKMQQGDGISTNLQWRKVLEYVFSPNPGEWKLAIIEADVMLENLIDQMGFKGENLGEKLKSADRDKFHSLSSAWEAHTIRNKIAHEGSDFGLSAHEAKRVIALYEQIFREFNFI